ncbi:MAG: DUF960 family protein [Oscillospiraceae bacterium]
MSGSKAAQIILAVLSVLLTATQPQYRKEYQFCTETNVTAKVYVIDDGDHCTMLLAEEY